MLHCVNTDDGVVLFLPGSAEVEFNGSPRTLDSLGCSLGFYGQRVRLPFTMASGSVEIRPASYWGPCGETHSEAEAEVRRQLRERGESYCAIAEDP